MKPTSTQFLWLASACIALTPALGLAQQAGSSRVNPKDGLTYKWIPPGQFPMGCSPGDKQCFAGWEPPAQNVAVAKGFWIAQTETTQGAYKKVTGKNPSHRQGDDLPVETVSWDDAVAFCKAVGGNLPTEIQWEYAARGGTKLARYGPIDEIAWYHENSLDQPHPVAKKKPNAFGLYDMYGNVAEWTLNIFDPEWEAKYGAKEPPDKKMRTIRGGSWFNFSNDCRASSRGMGQTSTGDEFRGFRCILE